MQEAFEFRTIYGQECFSTLLSSGFFPSAVFNRQVDLIEEEFAEVMEASRTVARNPEDRDCRPELLKELADLVFVCYQMSAAFGMDLDEAMGRIRTSNLSKLGSDGAPIRRADGKILKGENYVPPTLIDLIPEA